MIHILFAILVLALLLSIQPVTTDLMLTALPALARQHWREPALALALLAALLAAGTPTAWRAAGLCLLSVGFSILTCLLGALWPARAAARLSPAAALSSRA
mgnify:CR=1 FL=1